MEQSRDRWRTIALVLGLCCLVLLPAFVLGNVRTTYINEIALLRTRIVRPDIAMVGDSLIANGAPWGLKLHRDPFSVVSIAKGGLTAWQLQPVVRSGVALRPRTIVLIAGTNDLGQRHYDIDESVRDIMSLVDIAGSSGARVIVTLTPPVAAPARSRAAAKLVGRLKPLLRSHGVTTVDLWPVLAPHGVLLDKYTEDGTHFNQDGYEKWSAELRRVLF